MIAPAGSFKVIMSPPLFNLSETVKKAKALGIIEPLRGFIVDVLSIRVQPVKSTVSAEELYSSTQSGAGEGWAMISLRSREDASAVCGGRRR